MFGFDSQAVVSAWIWVLGQNDEAMKVEAAGESDFQPYIFWAYGLACALLLLCSIWTVAQVRALDNRVHDLKMRLEEEAER